MELFTPVRKLLPILVGYDVLLEYDIIAPNLFQKNLCRYTSFLGYIVLLSGVILVFGFLAFEGNKFEDYTDNFFAFITLLNDTFYFLSMPWLCRDILKMNEYYNKQ